MSNLKQIATRSLGKSGLILKKYSPEILTGVGIAAGVAAGVLAVRATLKVEPVVENFKSDIHNVKERWDGIDEEAHPDAKREKAKDLAYVYTRSSLEMIKLYGPSVSLSVASITCIIGAHGIMKKRNAALVIAYNALEKTFTEYRARVVNELGEDKEFEIRSGIVKAEVTDEETGKKSVVHTFDPNGISQYAKFFDEYSTQWQKNPEYNLLFLRAQQNYANDRLHAVGHVFLNEVYDSLGLPRTKTGAIVGWVISADSDNFIDFGMYDIDSDKAREFVNGYERSILLDFNVDGVILDKI